MTNSAIAFAIVLGIAVFYGVIFKNIYPYVNIDAGLALGFALAGILTYAIFRAVLLQLKRQRSSKV